MLYDIQIKEDSTENPQNEKDNVSVASPSDAIDYDKLGDTIYNNTYQALTDYYNNNPLKNNISDNNVRSLGSETPLTFASSTDATLYTVETVGAVSSVAEQTTALTLEIRNLLLIFILCWLIITIYSKLKNTLINYLRG